QFTWGCAGRDRPGGAGLGDPARSSDPPRSRGLPADSRSRPGDRGLDTASATGGGRPPAILSGVPWEFSSSRRLSSSRAGLLGLLEELVEPGERAVRG